MDNSYNPSPKPDQPKQNLPIESEIISKPLNSSPVELSHIPTPPSAEIGGEGLTEKGVKKEDVRDMVDEAKKDFITIFGLFAALLIFLSLEVQVFQQAKRFSYVMGVSFFLLSAILMFVLAIHMLFNNEKKIRRYWPILLLIILFFMASAACFLWGIEHTLAFWKLFKRS